MKVIVHTLDITMEYVKWYHKVIPSNKHYREIRMKDYSKYGGPKELPVIYGIGFISDNELDPYSLNSRKNFRTSNIELRNSYNCFLWSCIALAINH